MRVSIGSDHRGIGVKAKLVAALNDLGHEVRDYGTECDQSVDYPDFAALVCKSVQQGDSDRGILICGTGIGMAIAANKHRGIRAANCFDEVMAELSRRHNDVNVLCLPGDMIGDRPIHDLILIWLNTEFEGGRHLQRLEKIAEIEQREAAQADYPSSLSEQHD